MFPYKKHLFHIILFAVLSLSTRAQVSPYIKDGLRLNLNTDSTQYIKLNFLSQVWIRYNESNPGTTIAGTNENETFDVGLRRTRFVFTGQLTDRVFFFIQFGQNNFTYLSSRKAGSFFHDVTGEYAFINQKLSIGAGLMGWNGLARYSNSSVSSILCIDPPIFQETTNDVNDQFVRKLGLYAKGKLGKLDYRISAGTPFITQTASSTPASFSNNSTYSSKPPKPSFQGYFMYQFLDQESNTGAGTVGTYLGKKRVFNIGTGFVYQDNAMTNRTASGDTAYNPMALFGVDAFYDTPLNKQKGTALTIYGGYFNYNFGPKYIRNVGAMNPADGTNSSASFNGAGNGFPMIGTGQIGYIQTGYLLKKDLLKSMGTLQPYVSVLYAKYDRLKDAVNTVDIGVNWLIASHNSKITFNYQNRPIYTPNANADLVSSSRKGEWVIQYQIAF